MILILILLLFLAAIAACAWGFWLSVKLMIRSFNRLTAPNFGPPTGARQEGPMMPSQAVAAPLRSEVPGWSAKLVSDHIAHCQRCRDDYVSGTLPLLEPSTISRVLALVEDHEPVAP
jgi:hypothetical protein